MLPEALQRKCLEYIKDVNTIKEEADNMKSKDSKTATDAKPTFA